MKFFAFLLLLIITLIKYIESCLDNYIRLTDCSWSGDPCNKYKKNECSEHSDCVWGHAEGPPEQLELGVDLGNGDMELYNADGGDPHPPMDIILCKGKNYKSCHFTCSIF